MMFRKFFYPVIRILFVIMQGSILSRNGSRKKYNITQGTKGSNKAFSTFRLNMFGDLKGCDQVKFSVNAKFWIFCVSFSILTYSKRPISIKKRINGLLIRLSSLNCQNKSVQLPSILVFQLSFKF